jgi:hypothetical protein
MLYDTAIGVLLRKTRLLSEAEAWVKSIDQNVQETIIKEYIQKDQLKGQGIDETGQVIGYYSEVTEMITRGRKMAGDHYTLEDTGAFFRSMYVVVLLDSIVIEANPVKDNENLFVKYGDGIIGLTDENKTKFGEIVKEKFIQYVRDTLQID